MSVVDLVGKFSKYQDLTIVAHDKEIGNKNSTVGSIVIKRKLPSKLD